MRPARGFLVLDKPAGATSRDAVNVVQRLARPNKVGHAGTLDPLATGVLVVGVGDATRLIEFAQEGRKEYEAEFLFGRSSDTEDIEGQVVELADPPRPSRAELESALRGFLGSIMQRPPAYSALKVAGRRAYDLARRGEAVELAPRPVEIHELELRGYEYPRWRLRVVCGAGTYVRSLGRDVAERLGTAAVMSALRRTRVGPFALADAMLPASLSTEDLAERLRSPLLAVAHLPRVVLDEEAIDHVWNGRNVRLPPGSEQSGTEQTGTELGGNELDGGAARNGLVVAVDARGELVSLLRPRPDGAWSADRNFKPLASHPG